MTACVICKCEFVPAKPKSSFRDLCPICGGLLRWFRFLYKDREEDHVIEGIKPETTFLSLSVDSLDYISWVMEAEERFKISLPDEVAERIQSVGEFLRYIREWAPAERLVEGSVIEMDPQGTDPLWDRDLDG